MNYMLNYENGEPMLKETVYTYFPSSPISAIDSELEALKASTRRTRADINEYIGRIKLLKNKEQMLVDKNSKVISFKQEVGQAIAKGAKVPRLTLLKPRTPRAKPRVEHDRDIALIESLYGEGLEARRLMPSNES